MVDHNDAHRPEESLNLKVTVSAIHDILLFRALSFRPRSGARTNNVLRRGLSTVGIGPTRQPRLRSKPAVDRNKSDIFAVIYGNQMSEFGALTPKLG